MLNSRNTTLLFFILLFLLNLILLAGYPVPPCAYILLVSLYFFISVYFSFFIRSGFYCKAYCIVRTEEKKIALTFDDGPDPVMTPLILDILKGRAKASFFVTGRKLEGNEEIIRRMDKEGHIVGNHSWSHSNWFDFYSADKIISELQETDRKIGSVIGKKPLFFRPPYGVVNPLVKKALDRMPYHVIGFSNRAWDTSAGNEQKIFERLTKKLNPGDIVLLHDTVKSTVNVLPRFLDHLEKYGYKIVSLDELLDIKSYV
jgi:peptidoglycan-N-acetylglucosamine deacetylase